MRIICYITLLGFMISCVDPIDFDLTEGKKLLVVEGLVTDQEEPYLVKITRTAAYDNVFDNGYNEPVMNCSVKIIDYQQNTRHELAEVAPGLYSSSSTGFIGAVGSIYQLEISTPEGELYYSNPETLLNYYGFDNLESQVASKEYLNSSNNVVTKKGMDINVSFSFDDSEQHYIRWGYSYDFLIDQELVQIDDYGYVNVMSSADYNTLHIENHNVLFIEQIIGIGRALDYKLEIRQYTISKEVYDFWNSAESQIDNQGTIFDPVLSQTHGNIYNANDPNEVVLGIFSASGVNTRKIEFTM